MSIQKHSGTLNNVLKLSGLEAKSHELLEFCAFNIPCFALNFARTIDFRTWYCSCYEQ